MSTRSYTMRGGPLDGQAVTMFYGLGGALEIVSVGPGQYRMTDERCANDRRVMEYLAADNA